MTERALHNEDHSIAVAPPSGFDPLRQGAHRSVYWIPSHKSGSDANPVTVATSFNEFLVALHLEFDPAVRSFSRGDVSAKAADDVPALMGTPFWLPFAWERRLHAYLPDYVGYLADGRPFLC